MDPAYDSSLQRGYCQTPFGQVHYWITGKGPYLTMLHQASQSADEYATTAPLLAESFQVLAIDMPGHGRSDDPDHELSADEFITATMAVLDDLGIDRTHIVGHHSGVSLGIGIAADFPERVDKLILSGVVTQTPKWTKAFFEKPMTRDLPIDADGDFLLKTWEVYRSMSAPGLSGKLTFLPFLVGLQARLRPYDAHHAILRWDRNAAIARLKIPVLLLQGEHDSFVCDQDEILQQLPGSAHTLISDCGAFMFYERPEACARAILEYLSASNES